VILLENSNEVESLSSKRRILEKKKREKERKGARIEKQKR
jgi:hypothetical protein